MLHAVEDGLVTLIGATTENPYFEVNSALLSRCSVIELEPLTEEELASVVGRGAAALGIEVAARDRSRHRRAVGRRRAQRTVRRSSSRFDTAQAEGSAARARARR